MDGFRTAAERALTTPGPIVVVAQIEPAIQVVQPKTSDIFEDKYGFTRYIERTEGVEILTPATQWASAPAPGSAAGRARS